MVMMYTPLQLVLLVAAIASGLEFRPVLKGYENNYYLWYNSSDQGSYKKWTTQLDKFLEVYRSSSMLSQKMHNCDYDNPPRPGQVCRVDVRNWYPCNTENDFDFPRQAPCIYIKFDELYDRLPEFYNDTTNLPSSMPNQLKQYIRGVPSKELNTVWVSCQGVAPVDAENVGPIEYIPRQGFPGYYFPHRNSTEGYLSPLVAIRFARPQAGVVINVECKVWAKDIKNDGSDHVGYAQFEILIDN